MPRESFLLLGVLTATCLLLGMVVGIATGKLAEPGAGIATASLGRNQRTAPPPATLTPGAQKSLLVIGLDDAEANQPRLEGCWVITYRAGVPEYYVLAFPPATTFELESMSGPRTLTEIYAEDARLQLNHRFLVDAVRERFPALSIKADLVLDREDLSELVRRLGGLTMDDQLLSGPMLIDVFDRLETDASGDRALFEAEVFRALFGLLAERDWSPEDVADFVREIPRVAADGARVATLDGFAAEAPALDESRLKWQAYAAMLEPTANQ